MKTHKFFHAFAVFSIVLLSLFSFVPTAAAKGSATVGTTLTIAPPVSVTVGNPAIVNLQLVSTKGQPVANQPVELSVNGKRERRARTDASGNVSIRVRRDESGTYKLSAVFKGSRIPSLGSSRASAELVIKPEMIEIHTTPSLPDIKFSLDGEVFSSDDYGVARIQVDKAGTYQLEVLPLELEDSHIQMNFDRWGDEAFKPAREIVVPLNKPLDVGFEVHYRVSQTFVDLANEPVDPARVTSITYKGSNGATFTFEDTGTHWLPAGRVIRMNKGLEETKILYSVMSVVIDGANVVSQAQQRFYVNQDDTWTIQLLLYAARFTARDALFGFPIGSGIRMEYPDGEVQSYSFDPTEGYLIEGLARGIYRVTVTGAKGYAPATPIALSRDQDVELLVFSYIDIGVILSLGLLLSVGLLLFGRPYLIGETIAFGRRVRHWRPKIEPATWAQSIKKMAALGAGTISRRKTVKSAEPRMLDATAAYDSSQPLTNDEPIGSTASPVPADKDALPNAILEAAQDLLVENANDPAAKRAKRSHQKNEVESPI